MSTINTTFRNYVFPLKDEDLESSNNLLRVSFEAIDTDMNTLFTTKADISNTITEGAVDTKISDAITAYDLALDIYGTYVNGDVNTDGVDSNKLVLPTIMGSPGVHTKVTVNEKGQITAGGTIGKADLTDFTEADYVHWAEVDDASTAVDRLWSANKINSMLSGVSGDLSNYVPLTSYTDQNVLDKVKNVDGTGSGLDADLLDGEDGSHYLAWTNFTGLPTTLVGYGITDAYTKAETDALNWAWTDITSGVPDFSVKSQTTVTAAPTVDVDLGVAEVVVITMDQDVVFTASNLVNGQRGSIIIKQDATGGHVMTVPTECVFPGPSGLSTGANAVDKVDYVIADGVIYCTIEKTFS